MLKLQSQSQKRARAIPIVVDKRTDHPGANSESKGTSDLDTFDSLLPKNNEVSVERTVKCRVQSVYRVVYS